MAVLPWRTQRTCSFRGVQWNSSDPAATPPQKGGGREAIKAGEDGRRCLTAAVSATQRQLARSSPTLCTRLPSRRLGKEEKKEVTLQRAHELNWGDAPESSAPENLRDNRPSCNRESNSMSRKILHELPLKLVVIFVVTFI